jgi:uncharacterized sulfatase
LPARRAGTHRATSRIVEFLDMYPTLAEMAGLVPPSNLARSIARPAAEGSGRGLGSSGVDAGASRERRGRLFMGYSIRTAKWRYTEWDAGKRGAELYDEQADPAETKNLAPDSKYQSVIADLRQELQRLRREWTRVSRGGREVLSLFDGNGTENVV